MKSKTKAGSKERKNTIGFRFGPKAIELLKYRGFYARSGKPDDMCYSEERLSSGIFRRDNIAWTDILKMPYKEMRNLLFAKDSIIPQDVCRVMNRSFSTSFGNDEMFYDVEAICLEPYVARYVRAINRCGMKTSYSCDGWHMSSKRSAKIVILFDDRYSWLWHKTVCDHYALFCWDNSDQSISFQLPREDDEKKKIYDRVNATAVFLRVCDTH